MLFNFQIFVPYEKYDFQLYPSSLYRGISGYLNFEKCFMKQYMVYHAEYFSRQQNDV